MSKSRLTAAFLNTVKKPGKYYDGNGLFVQVYPTGARCWQQRVTIRGRRHTLGLGGYPVVTLKMARDLALENLRTVRSGGDPLALKRRNKAPTFRQAAAIVLEHHRPTWTEVGKPRRWMRSLEIYAMPILGDLPVSNIAPRDILAVLLPIWGEKPETGKKVRQRISAVMRWAVAEGHADTDPTGAAIAGALPRHTKPRKHFPAVPHQQVSAALAKVHASAAPPGVKLVIEFLVLTAVRSSEARGARWTEIDFEAATWTVPAERMKSRSEHRVPLSSRALSVLGLARQHSGTGELVFPSPSGRVLDSTALSKLLRRLDVGGVVHGFRSSFRDWCGETGIPRELAEACLSHTVGSQVEAAYARSDLFQRRTKVMEDWAQYLSRMDTSDSEPAPNL